MPDISLNSQSPENMNVPQNNGEAPKIPAPEAPAAQEVNVQVEQPTAAPVQAQAPVDQVLTPAPIDDQIVVATSNPASADQEESGDRDWVKKTQGVIKQYEDQPYEEEEASEKLQEEYLKSRFNVDVDNEEKI